VLFTDKSMQLTVSSTIFGKSLRKFDLKILHFGNKSSTYYHKYTFGLHESADNFISF